MLPQYMRLGQVCLSKRIVQLENRLSDATDFCGMVGQAPLMRALFDLIALAGFVLAIVMIYQIWRARQNDRNDT